jgi:DNA-binding PadR family transcriptional regulator
MRRRSLSSQARLLLSALLDQPREWQYGYDLSKQTGLKSGTLYPLLIRLTEQGLLQGDWRDADEPGRPPRHIYRLTTEGADVARAEATTKSSRRVALRPARATS